MSNINSINDIEEISETAIIDCLTRRFNSKKWCTMDDQCVVFVNPMQNKVNINMFSNHGFISKMVNQARSLALADNKAQTIVLRGQHGSGKTEISKYIIQYLIDSTVLEDRKTKYFRLGSFKNQLISSNPTKIHEALIAGVSLLDMFGMAPSSCIYKGSKDFHPNSSRHSRMIQIYFDPSNISNMLGFHISSSGLDTSRLKNFKETSFSPFHIFGCLIGSIHSRTNMNNIGEFADFKCTATQCQQVLQHFCNHGVDYDSNSAAGDSPEAIAAKELEKELEHFKKVLMKGCDLSEEQWIMVLKCLMCIIHLQSVGVSGSDISPGRIVGTTNVFLTTVENLLGISSPGSLNKILSRIESPNPNSASGLPTITDFKKSEIIANIDALCTEIYTRVFTWLLDKINDVGNVKADSSQSTLCPINIVDIPGNENVNDHYSGFSQMYNNTLADKLNNQFSKQCFTDVLNGYKEEGIPFNDDYIVIPNTAPVVNLFEAPTTGLFSIIEDVSALPKGDEKLLIEKMVNLHGTKNTMLFKVIDRTASDAKSSAGTSVGVGKYGASLASKDTKLSTYFSINHSFGTVKYDCDQFIGINKNYIGTDLAKMLNMLAVASDANENPIECLKGSGIVVDTDASVAPVVAEPVNQFKRMANKLNVGGAAVKKSMLVMTSYREAFNKIANTCASSKCHFIMCIRPCLNNSDGEFPNGSSTIDNDMLKTQVESLNITELGILCKETGYPYQALYHDFYHQFRPMLSFSLPNLPLSVANLSDSGLDFVKLKELCGELFRLSVEAACLPSVAPVSYESAGGLNEGPNRNMAPIFSKNKVFMKNDIYKPLMAHRTDALNQIVFATVVIQRLWRLSRAYLILKYKILLPYKHLRPAYCYVRFKEKQRTLRKNFNVLAVTVNSSKVAVIKKTFAFMVYMFRLKQRYDIALLNKAASVIQKTYVGKFKFKLRYARMKRAVQLLQFLSKGYIIRRETMSIVYAARIIRKNLCLYGYKLRKVRIRVYAAVTVQCVFRGWLCREKYARMVRIIAAKRRLRVAKKCVVKLQSIWRGKVIHRKYNFVKFAAECIQRWCRQVIIRNRFLQICMLAQWLQTHARRIRAKNIVKIVRLKASLFNEKMELLKTRVNEVDSSSNELTPNGFVPALAAGGTVMDRCFVGSGVLRDGQLKFCRCVAGLDITSHTIAQVYPHGWLNSMRLFMHELETVKKKQILHVAVGERHTVVVDELSNVYSFGSSEFGQLGHGNRKNISKCPKMIEGMKNHVAAVDQSGGGSTVARGKSIVRESVMERRGGGIGSGAQFVIKQIVCGKDFTMILSGAGRVYSWGSNCRGQLGHSDFQDSAVPRNVNGLKNIAKIGCGDFHGVALTHTGAVYTWGAWECLGRVPGGNVHDEHISAAGAHKGEAGIHSAAAHPDSTGKKGTGISLNRRGSMMQAKKTATAPATSSKSSRAAKAAEAVSTVENTNILDPSTIPHTDSCQAGVVSYFLRRGIVSIVCGSEHTCVLHVDGSYGGTLYSFGKNTYGQCGSGNTKVDIYVLPRRIRAGLPYPISESDALMSALHSGGRTMGYLLKGQLYMWGWNKFGQVGTSNLFSNSIISTPVAVDLGDGAEISKQSHHIVHALVNYRQTVVMTSEGRVYVWGYTDALFEQTAGKFNRVNHARAEELKRDDIKVGEGLGSVSGMGKLFSGSQSDAPALPSTVIEEDVQYCKFSPYLWSNSCGVVPRTSSLIGSKPIRYRHRPSELSSAAVSTKVSPFGPIFQFLPGFGTCSSATLSVLMFDRVKGIEVDEAVLSKLSGQRFQSKRTVTKVAGAFETDENKAFRSSTAPNMNSTNAAGTSRRKTITSTTSMAFNHNSKPLQKSAADFHAEVKERFKKEVNGTISGALVRRFSVSAGAADMAAAAAIASGRSVGVRPDDDDEDIANAIQTNVPSFAMFSGSSFEPVEESSTVQILSSARKSVSSAYNRSREGSVSKLSTMDLIMKSTEEKGPKPKVVDAKSTRNLAEATVSSKNKQSQGKGNSKPMVLSDLNDKPMNKTKTEDAPKNTLLTRFAASQSKKESIHRSIEEDLAELQLEVKKVNALSHGKVGVGTHRKRNDNATSSHKQTAAALAGAAGGTDLNSIINSIKRDNMHQTQKRQIGLNSM